MMRVAIVAGADAEALDITGPWEVFATANRFRGSRAQPIYAIELVSTMQDCHIRTSSGVVMLATSTLAELALPVDTMLITGGRGDAIDAEAKNAELLAWVRETAPSVRRLCSLDTGAFVLAATGLLRGRRATTHWSWCGELSKRCPDARVDAQPTFVCDRGIYTSAGITASIDLALALVEEDLGREVASRTARQLVLYLRRPGGQAQLSAALALQAADRQTIRDLQSWILDHLTADLSVPALARQSSMSPRNFARVFALDTGFTPARFVERIRVDAAQRRLEESDHSASQIAGECGFSTPESMRRAFRRVLKQTPGAIRGRQRQGPRPPRQGPDILKEAATRGSS